MQSTGRGMNFLVGDERSRFFVTDRRERWFRRRICLFVCCENWREFSRVNSFFFVKKNVKSFAVFLL